MLCEDKIRQAYSLLSKNINSLETFQNHIIETQMDIEECLIKLKLDNGMFVYLTYNSHDRERFDNYDKNWNVKTAPHHFHKRFSDEVTDSNMIGIPELDIPLMIQFLLKYFSKMEK